MTTTTSELRCTFCGKQHTEVAKLIAGPGIYICDGCVDLCIGDPRRARHRRQAAIDSRMGLADG